ncbi:unnamed protein product [Rodentolepis nana]|uniref:Spore coat associated protein JA (CotJA) n=1 Tax=Rodentolepis nana TaxID=102285 RepID=A0A0R3TNP0_RODNA|nr:unnamed protein product [Rodentolepis nana]
MPQNTAPRVRQEAVRQEAVRQEAVQQFQPYICMPAYVEYQQYAPPQPMFQPVFGETQMIQSFNEMAPGIRKQSFT